MQTYTCEQCGKDTPNELVNNQCNECNSYEDNNKLILTTDNITETAGGDVIITHGDISINKLIKAINNHDALVEALKDCIQLLQAAQIGHNTIIKSLNVLKQAEA